MSLRHARLIAGLAAVILPVVLVDAARPQRAQAPVRGSLAGQLLVASQSLTDPNFSRTVVLMVRHDATGAMGIVINRPLGEHTLARLLAAFGDKDADVTGNVQIFAGGPVQRELGFVIHSTDYRRPETIAIDAHLAVTASRDILRDIGTGKGPQKILVALGYAGWGPGQLEGEMMLQAWAVAPADVKLIFEEERDTLWDNALTRRTQDL